MRVVEVIPIVKGITKPSLSYFTKEKFNSGSFVRIPVISGKSLGIVVSSVDARSAKTDLKKADFALKKISLVEKISGLPDSFMLAAEDTANFYTTTVGSVLSAVIPKLFLQFPELISNKTKEKEIFQKEVKLVQLGNRERFLEYRSIVRESFAKETSVMFVVPTKEDGMKAESLICNGIENFVFNITNKTPTKLKNLLQKAKNEKHPILFITTPFYIAFNRPDLKTIILEKENSRNYRTPSRPFINFKKFLEFLARRNGSTLILGDAVLSLESLWLEREGRYSELSPLTWRLKHMANDEIVDMKAIKDFSILSERLVNLINKTLKESKKVFLFGARKGLASVTICGDCASLLLCKNCGAPLVLHKKNSGKTIYICHHCGAKRSSETRCDTCQSWKLNPLGIGVDRIEEECKRLFPDTEIFVLDRERVKTKSQSHAVIKKFQSASSAILIGTELAVHLIEKVELVAAVSLDSLFSIPDFYINERIFYLITELREKAVEKFAIQTRNAGESILENAAAGNVLDFYRDEIKEREELRYPPFSIFIKVSGEDSKERIERKAVQLQASFSQFDPHFILENKKEDRLQTLSMILRVQRDEWPDKILREKLLLLTPDFSIKVDPESII